MGRTQLNAEREHRIDMEVVVDAYTAEERALSWYYYLEEQLSFPCEANVRKAMASLPLPTGEPVSVIGLAHEDRCRIGIFVWVRWGQRDAVVPLAQIVSLNGSPRGWRSRTGTTKATRSELHRVVGQVDERIGGFASLCEPLVIAVLGALVGGLVIAMYLPIIRQRGVASPAKVTVRPSCSHRSIRPPRTSQAATLRPSPRFPSPCSTGSPSCSAS
ncbi:unnamed protein product [Candidatus Paraburkholderia kirkii UZHbot1]|uniref:WGS project CAFE00000000 data, contig bkir_c171 n=1 Tax=Candidatus Paraburkholderia kirkii UZHbot1 TaxID=1055526 RepID=U3UAQ2_9BURK|nr:unnamed protein product [Candidatus Paraburkholderia kirkii UZHbot1]